jgi:hypothetical protein
MNNIAVILKILLALFYIMKILEKETLDDFSLGSCV